MTRMAQKGSPVYLVSQSLATTHLASFGNHLSDLKTPVDIEILHYPAVTLHIRELCDDSGQMSAGTGSSLAQIPHDLSRGHDKRGDQHSGPMAHIFVLVFLGLTRFNQLIGVFALKNLHPGLFIGADD